MPRYLGGTAAILLCTLLPIVHAAPSQNIRTGENIYEFNHAHFHLTNYIQEGTPVRELLKIMGTTTVRSTLFGIPLQQQWSYRVCAPMYCLHTDAPLHSFTDTYIAMTYLSLPPQDHSRFDPMITGFNPADNYERKSEV